MLRERLRSNKFNRDVIWNYFSLAILATGGFVINLVIARFRGDEALGIFNQVFAFYQIISQFSAGGIHLSVLKEVSYNQENKQACSDIFVSGIILVAIIAGAFCLAGYSLAHWVGNLLQSEKVGIALQLAMPGLLVFSMNKVLLWTLNGLRYMRIYAVFQSMRYILLTLTIVGLIIFNAPNVLIPVALTTTELVMFIFLFPFVVTRLHLPGKLAGAITWFPKHLSFGVRSFMSGALNEINVRVDVLMLGLFASDAQVGIYSFASTLAGGFIQLPMVLRWNIDPLLGAHFAKGETASIENLARKVRKYFYPALAGICAIVVLGYPFIFSLLLKKSNIATASWEVFAILIVGVLVASRFRPFYGILLQGGYPGTNTMMILALTVTNVVLNLLLVPILGIFGAAISMTGMYCLEAFLLFTITKRLYGIKL